MVQTLSTSNHISCFPSPESQTELLAFLKSTLAAALFPNSYLLEVRLTRHLFGEASSECVLSPYLYQSPPPPPLPIPVSLNWHHPSGPPRCALVCELRGDAWHGLWPLHRPDQIQYWHWEVRGADEGMTLYLQPAHSEEPPQMDRVDPKAQIKRIADRCWYLRCRTPGCNCTPRGGCANPLPGSHRCSTLQWEDAWGPLIGGLWEVQPASSHWLPLSYRAGQGVWTRLASHRHSGMCVTDCPQLHTYPRKLSEH